MKSFDLSRVGSRRIGPAGECDAKKKEQENGKNMPEGSGGEEAAGWAKDRTGE